MRDASVGLLQRNERRRRYVGAPRDGRRQIRGDVLPIHERVDRDRKPSPIQRWNLASRSRGPPERTRRDLRGRRDRKSGVYEKSVDLGGRRIIKQKTSLIRCP